MFEKLFEPGKIGRMVIKNRVVMAPMGPGVDVPGRVDPVQPR